MQNRRMLASLAVFVVVAAVVAITSVIVSFSSGSRGSSDSPHKGVSRGHEDSDVPANEEVTGNNEQLASGTTNQNTSDASALPKQAGRESNIDSGFVFMNGKYISVPYEVSVQKGWLHVNDVRIRKLCEWPIKERPREEGKPKIPERIFKNARSFEDLRIPDGGFWHGRMARWITKTSSSEEERRNRVAEFYKKLPFVRSLRWVEPHIFEVVLRDGNRKRFGFSGVSGMDLGPPREEDILDNLNYEVARFKQHLQNGYVILYFGTLQVSFAEPKAARDLGVMIQIFESDRTNQEKLELLNRMDMIPIGQAENIEPYLGSFRATDQLKQRIAELEARTDIEPRSIKDIPDVSPAEREMRLLEAATGQPEN